MNLILIGYRASGKTTLGRAVAEKLGWRFIDTDDRVRTEFEGRTIADIWQQEGEKAFRAAECRVVRRLLKQDRQVIALGGGTPMQTEAYQALREDPNAFCVYLAAPAEVLAERIAIDAGSADQRPALTPLGGGLDEVSRTLALREPTYRDQRRAAAGPIATEPTSDPPARRTSLCVWAMPSAVPMA
ncbi:MAG: shikimate kinase, partial [Phycisphaeraceae bacterium]|nr:shikimate kinase [Phycisphaeraceae bacterium]